METETIFALLGTNAVSAIITHFLTRRRMRADTELVYTKVAENLTLTAERMVDQLDLRVRVLESERDILSARINELQLEVRRLQERNLALEKREHRLRLRIKKLEWYLPKEIISAIDHEND